MLSSFPFIDSAYCNAAVLQISMDIPYNYSGPDHTPAASEPPVPMAY